MAYKHGTYQGEVASDIALPVSLDYGYFIVGTAPIHKVAKNKRSTNVVKRIGNYAEALEYFGGIEDLDFSISQAIKSAFTLYGVAPLFIVNILDLEKHKTESSKTLENLTLKNGKVLVENHKIITDTLVVKKQGGETIADATHIWTEKGLEIYARPDSGNEIEIEFNEVDLTKVTKTEALGGYNTDTMTRTGLELLDEVFNKYSELPAFVDVPDFSHNSDVAVVMETKAKNINGGMFEAIPLINAPVDKRYDEIPAWKEQNNILDEDQVVLYGRIGFGGDVYYQSIHYAHLSMYVDGQDGGVPSQSPSNYKYKMDSLLIKNAQEKWQELTLDKETQANFLNKNGVVTAINFKGWRCWGSETALNPLATDPKDKFIYARRMFKFIGNELVITYFNKVDQKLTFKLAETITKSINLRLGALVATGHFIEAKAELSKEDNDVINVINGDITWLIKLGVAPGLKSLTFKKKYDVAALEKFAARLAE